MRNEKGFILVLSMLMVLMLTVVGLAAMDSSIFEINLAGNQLLSKQAFYNAESGLDLWKYDLAKGNTVDNSPTDVSWTLEKTYTDNGIKAVATGSHVTEVVSGVTQVKKINGKPVYRVISHGYSQESHRITEAVFAFNPNLEPPSALYTHTDPLINSAKAEVSGLDICGSDSKPGIITTQSLITIKNGTVEGFPANTETNSSLNINIPQFVDSIKNYATASYTGGTMSNGSWGETTSDTPVMPKDPNLPPQVVYFDGNTKLTTSGGTGILLVKGDLELSGGFSWYGIVVATGSLKFTGNGGMNITGGVMSGSDATIDDTIINGGVKINMCSSVKDFLKNIPGSKRLSWREVF